MSPKNKKSFSSNMPSGINIMGMGGTGEELNQPSSAAQPKVSGKQLMKSNGQSS